MKKYLLSLLLVLILALALPFSVLALDISAATWFGVITVSNNDTAETNVATVFTLNTTPMVDLGYMNESGNNTAIVTSSGAKVAYMPGYAGNVWGLWVPSIAAETYQTDVLYTGGSANMDAKIRYFPGAAGMTTSDAASLELGDNFTVELNGFIGNAGDIFQKQDAFSIDRGTSNITATINGSAQQSLITGEDANTAVSGVNWAAQMFTTENITYMVEKISLRMHQATTPDTVTVSIRATAANLPAGADLTSGTMDGNFITVNAAGDWYEIDVTDYQLSPSTQYAIVLRAQNPTLFWHRDATAPPYPGGWSATSVNSGVAWTAVAGSDYMFQVINTDISVSAGGITSAEHTVNGGMDSPFLGLGVDTTFELPVTENLTFNAPLWQTESNSDPFLTIDSGAYTVNVNGATWTTSSGYSFDGNNDYLDTDPPDTFFPAGLSEFTIQVWVNMAAANVSGAGIVGGANNNDIGIVSCPSLAFIRLH